MSWPLQLCWGLLGCALALGLALLRLFSFSARRECTASIGYILLGEAKARSGVGTAGDMAAAGTPGQRRGHGAGGTLISSHRGRGCMPMPTPRRADRHVPLLVYSYTPVCFIKRIGEKKGKLRDATTRVRDARPAGPNFEAATKRV